MSHDPVAASLARGENRTAPRAPSDPLVLFYTNFFDGPVDIATVLQEAPGRWTCDRRLLPQADAVVFHLPNHREIRDAVKYPGQCWIAWSMESRMNYPAMNDPDFMKHFDVVMSYQSCADVHVSYLPPLSQWLKAQSERIPEKTEDAPLVMFQSARADLSGRMSFVKDLARHISIDSYGRFLRNRFIDGPDRGTETKLETIKRYRFCLALENSFDPDYVTERIFQPMLMGTVPVYRGAPNVQDYVPPNSYVDARDFDGPEALASYLRYLAETPDAYNAYLAWRENPLPEAFLSRLRRFETPAFQRLRTILADWVSQREAPPGRQATLPFGYASFLRTRLRRLRKTGRLA